MTELDRNLQRTLARTRADGTVRSRAYHGYSRNGCARCKQQRVRCDERHPECNRCVRVGVKCPGYEQKLRWSDKHEVLHGSASAGISKAGPSASSSSSLLRPARSPPDGPGLQIVSVMPGPLPKHAQRPQKRPQSLPQPQPEPLQPSPRSSSPPGCYTETSPASQASSSDTIELGLGMPSTGTHTAGGAASHDHHASSGAANANANAQWDPAYLDLLDQLAAPAASPDVSDFYMGLDSSFLADRKMPSAGMFLGGMLPLADTATTAAATAATAGSGPFLASMTGSVLHQPVPAPVPTPFGALDDVGLDDLWRGGHTPVDLHDSVLAGMHPLDEAGVGNVVDVEGAYDGHAAAVYDDEAAASPYTLPPSQRSLPAATARSPSPLRLALTDIGSVLVEFYFKETAKIYACYDGRMNPFRTTVVDLWTSSEIINCTAQSMAAGCLLREFPQLAPVGRQLRQKATRILAKTKVWDTHTMLAVLMLGGTASWHDSKDLGLPFFHQIAERLAVAPPSVFREGEDYDSSNYRFFYESMQYWEMQLAFLTDDATLPGTPETHRLSDRVYGKRAVRQGGGGGGGGDDDGSDEEAPGRTDDTHESPAAHETPLPRLPPAPHPWTGFAGETQRTVQKVGRLLRRQRTFDFGHRFASVAHISQLQADMQTARELEARLLRIAHPAEHAVRDTEDGNTPVWHLLTLAEIIRHVGLIQLYHVFPDLLSARLGRERAAGAGSYYNFGLAVPAAAITPPLCRRWLTTYTLRTLDMMRTLPVESGTRVFQPFLLVALSSELRTAGGCGGAAAAARVMPLDREAVEVARGRNFIHSRLQLFLHILPPKPMMMCLSIVQETWAQMDRQATLRTLALRGDGSSGDSRGRAATASEADVYWMDVMIENGWETVMG